MSVGLRRLGLGAGVVRGSAGGLRSRVWVAHAATPSRGGGGLRWGSGSCPPCSWWSGSGLRGRTARLAAASAFPKQMTIKIKANK